MLALLLALSTLVPAAPRLSPELDAALARLATAELRPEIATPRRWDLPPAPPPVPLEVCRLDVDYRPLPLAEPAGIGRLFAAADPLGGAHDGEFP